MNQLASLVAVLALFVVAQAAQAQTASFSKCSCLPTVEQINDDPSLVGKVITNFFVSTTSDILQFDSISISRTLYQHPLGSDSEPANPAFVQAFPALGADSYITTPGATSIAGAGFGSTASGWFDTTNDGPVTNFRFAQLTVALTDYTGLQISGNLQTKSSNSSPIIQSFYLINYAIPLPTFPICNVPEPHSLILGCMVFFCNLFIRLPRRSSCE